MQHTALTTYRAILAAAEAPAEAGRVKIPTSDRGYMMLQRDPLTLQRWADVVLKNWVLYGGGPKPAEIAKPARKLGAAWSATAVQVWREQLEIGQHADAARIGLEKLGARFYVHRAGQPFCLVAPKPVQGMPSCLMSGRRDDGKWIVFDIVSGQAVSAAGERTRAGAEKTAARAWTMRSDEQQANALRIARRDHTGTQAAALAAWCELHKVDPADIPAALADVEAADVAQAPAEAAPVATQAAPAPEPGPVPVASLYGDGSPDPRNSAPMPELDSYRPGDAVDVPGRTIGACTVLALFTRALAGFLDPSRIARVINADGKRLDVLTSELTRPAAPAAAPARTAAPAAHPRLADALQLLAAAVRPGPAQVPAPAAAEPAEVDPPARPALAGLMAEIDAITAAARERMRTGGAEIDAMTPAERARRHALLQQLPTFGQDAAAARARVAARVAIRRAASAAMLQAGALAQAMAGPVLPWLAMPHRTGLVRQVAASGPAGAFSGLLGMGPWTPCDDIWPAGAAAARGPVQQARPGFAQVWGARLQAGAFPGGIGATGGIPCDDIWPGAGAASWPAGQAMATSSAQDTAKSPANGSRRGRWPAAPAPHADAAKRPAVRIRPPWATAHPPPVATSTHHIGAARPAAVRIRPTLANAPPPPVAAFAQHPATC